MLTVEEAAELLKVGRTTIYDLIKTRSAEQHHDRAAPTRALLRCRRVPRRSREPFRLRDQRPARLGWPWCGCGRRRYGARQLPSLWRSPVGALSRQP
ncbi:helix-turn-helix domain-containing protein [Mangrovihabitans endophyticus]|uniref:helix-turn-helix domain-containing protein n=1 Tax=Mangrovihabitans endophyticus TaxID=1751298 RepID=UPI001E564259|nr:helix-turn-helix domain-containing protein [Mangrovihabitans endophyticus]